MSIGSKIAWIAFVLLVVSLSWWLFMHESPDYESLGQEKNVTGETSNSTDQIGVEDSVSQADGSQDGSAEKKGEGRELLAPTGIFLSGRVIDEVTKEPVTRFCINMSVQVEKGLKRWKEVQAKQFEDKDGAFFIPLEKGGRYRCWIRSSSYAVHRTDVDVPEDTGLAGQEFALNPGLVAWGRVVDDATGLPVADAIVAPAQRAETTELIRILQGKDQWTPHARTDHEGRFRLMGLPDVNALPPWLDNQWCIAAVHPDYAEGVARAKPGGIVEMVIRLERGHCFHGSMLDNDGQPAPGVMVRMSGEKIPLHRPVISGADGAYRTPPCLPGPVFLYAGPPPGQTEETLNFTEETKKVFMSKSDMEIHFGPSENHVTWKGTLFDMAGKPAALGTVKITPATTDFMENVKNKLERKVKCDREGRFEIGKLDPGTYKVEVQYSAWASNVDWGKITFEQPGLVEKDLVIKGARISGMVVDSITEEPLSGKWCYVSTMTNDRDYRNFSCPVDKEGRFVLGGLPAGTYRLSVSSKEYPFKLFHGFTLKKNEILDDVVLELSKGGGMKLELSGFNPSDEHNFELHLGMVEGRKINYGTQRIDESGTWRDERDLESGQWSVAVLFEGLGFAEKRFDIFPDQTTEVFIHRNELSLQEGDVMLAVTLVHPDTTPAAGIRVGFYGTDVPGLDKKERYRAQTTNENGRFTLDGFKPGKWNVFTHMEGGSSVNFPELIIPALPSNPYPLHLVLPTGQVTGVMQDNSTGHPLAEDGPLWWIFLRDVKTSVTVNEINGGHKGHSFTMKGISAGEYILRFHVRGYDELYTEPFFLAEGQIKDVGTILLEPAGIMILEVVDEKGEAVSVFKAFCNGMELHKWERENVSPGKYRYAKLPKGPVQLVIKAEGFVDREIKLDLEPGKEQPVKVTLSSL